MLLRKDLYAHSAVSQTRTSGCLQQSKCLFAGAKQGEQAARVCKTLAPQWLSGKGF